MGTHGASKLRRSAGVYDPTPLHRRYWVSLPLVGLVMRCSISRLSSDRVYPVGDWPRMELTYGQAALILYGAGIGAIFGARGAGLGDASGASSRPSSAPHPRHQRRADRRCPDRRRELLAFLRFLVGSVSRRGHPCPDDRRRSNADPFSYRDDELLRRVRQRGTSWPCSRRPSLAWLGWRGVATSGSCRSLSALRNGGSCRNRCAADRQGTLRRGAGGGWRGSWGCRST